MASLFLCCLPSNLCEGWSFSDESCYAPPDYSGPWIWKQRARQVCEKPAACSKVSLVLVPRFAFVKHLASRMEG